MGGGTDWHVAEASGSEKHLQRQGVWPEMFPPSDSEHLPCAPFSLMSLETTIIAVGSGSFWQRGGSTCRG